ncbi:carboxymuconolactone decarboxylase family protein [Paradesulfitobacterium ferrireducens]|uniref:carboxymuconolactone decarboxylase family protein n=1 Tax=Paradesulfitobacterium ferrireducens TaxID=2816476 RepID=UPI001A8FA6BF|nr:carboxymuconolactone decarboxylase family protein [Paradesulfitobacterium ferrireducens]
MANVQLLGDDNPETKDIFAKLKQKFGEVPPPFRAMANHPEYLKIVLQKMETIMGSDALDQITKLVIAFTVSTLNNCEFCINLYAQQLKDTGFTDKQFVELLAMIDFVGSMNHFNNGLLIKPNIER